ncbi:hypothetical protein CEXT_171911 [Caerostris extrusa]|uniref:Uncharacterized protein n=1 Tax=Caerostris extrusa TaxID=172846 RepID=A0AAV4V4T0_CAEEX|nr:hypothetical protein CEXT_171911 [Caerostris extrusa]
MPRTQPPWRDFPAISTFAKNLNGAQEIQRTPKLKAPLASRSAQWPRRLPPQFPTPQQQLRYHRPASNSKRLAL